MPLITLITPGQTESDPTGVGVLLQSYQGTHTNRAMTLLFDFRYTFAFLLSILFCGVFYSCSPSCDAEVVPSRGACVIDPCYPVFYCTCTTFCSKEKINVVYDIVSKN